MLVQKIPWTRQPPPGTPIDWGNPATKGLIAAISGIESVNLVTGRQLTVTGPNGVVVGKDGVSYPFNGTTYLSTPVSTGGAPYTLFAVETCTSAGANRVFCGLGDSGSSANLAEIYRGNTDSSLLFIEITAGASVQPAAVANSSVINSRYTVAGVTYSTTDRVAYSNGVKLASSTVSLPIISAANTFYVGVERYNGAFAGHNVGNIPLALLFTRALSAAEIKSLSDNPWQLFQPITRRIFGSAAGGATAITLTAASFRLIPRVGTFTTAASLTAALLKFAAQPLAGLTRAVLTSALFKFTALPITYVGAVTVDLVKAALKFTTAAIVPLATLVLSKPLLKFTTIPIIPLATMVLTRPLLKFVTAPVIPNLASVMTTALLKFTPLPLIPLATLVLTRPLLKFQALAIIVTGAAAAALVRLRTLMGAGS